MKLDLKCSCCGRAWCGLTYVNGTPFCDDCINKCVSGRDREMDELKAERDAIQRRAEAAEGDWQECEKQIVTLKATIEEKNIFINEEARKIAELKAIIQDHEEDCACLPEDRSVTETVTALCNEIAEQAKRIAELEAKLARQGYYRCPTCKAIVVNSPVCHKCDRPVTESDIIVPEVMILTLEQVLSDLKAKPDQKGLSHEPDSEM